MSKALVIKGANFLANRIEQISVSDPIPCTGIALSQNTLALTQIGATATLTATLTPVDTTDALTWTSFDSNIATVIDGVVTCVGVGTTTITATCGEHSASCLVTVTETINANETYLTINGYEMTNGMPSADKDYIGVYASSKRRIYANSENTIGATYQLFSVKGTSSYFGKYPLEIPSGTTKITVGSVGFTSATFVFLDALTMSVNSTYSCEKVVTDMVSVTFANGLAEIIVPNVTAEKLCFTLGLLGASNADTITDDVIVTFS